MGHLCRPFCGTFGQRAFSDMGRWLDWQACSFSDFSESRWSGCLVSVWSVSVFAMLWPEPPDQAQWKVVINRWRYFRVWLRYCWRTMHCWTFVPHVYFCHLDCCHAYLEEIWRSGWATGYYFAEKARKGYSRLGSCRGPVETWMLKYIMLNYRRDDKLQVEAKQFTTVHFHLISLPQAAAEKHHMTTQ